MTVPTSSSSSNASLAASAARIVITSALLARKKYARHSMHFGNESESLIAIDEDEQVVDFEKNDTTASPRHCPTMQMEARETDNKVVSATVNDVRMHPTDSHVIHDDGARSVSSTTSSLPTEAPIDGMSVASDEPEDNKFFISNIHDVNHNIGVSRTQSSRMSRATSMASSLIPGTTEHVEFYLPLLGPDKSGNFNLDATSEDPTALHNILRPWQVEFLKSLGIVKASQFLRVRKKRDLSKDMKKWRKRQNLKSVKGKSRKVALHIWAKTCKSVIESFEKQQAEGLTVVEKPAILKGSVSVASIASTVTANSFDCVTSS